MQSYPEVCKHLEAVLPDASFLKSKTNTNPWLFELGLSSNHRISLSLFFMILHQLKHPRHELSISEPCKKNWLIKGWMAAADLDFISVSYGVCDQRSTTLKPCACICLKYNGLIRKNSHPDSDGFHPCPGHLIELHSHLKYDPSTFVDAHAPQLLQMRLHMHSALIVLRIDGVFNYVSILAPNRRVFDITCVDEAHSWNISLSCMVDLPWTSNTGHQLGRFKPDRTIHAQEHPWAIFFPYMEKRYIYIFFPYMCLCASKE